MSYEFLLTSLIVVASPGTGVLYTIAAGLTRGSRASVIAAPSPARSASCRICWPRCSGLAAVLHTSALAFAMLKYCGVVYLLYMAWQDAARAGRARRSSAERRRARPGGCSSPAS